MTARDPAARPTAGEVASATAAMANDAVPAAPEPTESTQPIAVPDPVDGAGAPAPDEATGGTAESPDDDASPGPGRTPSGKPTGEPSPEHPCESGT